ncbi:hypothetical protein JRQ81_011520 [Phrynocephalus forsythii]|uniref:Uncharacterized protein n=1 Tax=Phrynocephalus forsythii TaxID=171643 RepID=A0A9Q1AQM4_9SAUR|nr:hypothetical protein JRQ81_011520 [Phrynocephalus forsythii]
MLFANLPKEINMNSCGMEEPRKHILTGSGLQCSFHQLNGSPLEPHNTKEKSTKVKHRRTRRERNSAKFGRNVTDRISEQKSTCRGLQKMLPPFWSSQLSQCAKSTPLPAIKGTCVAKPVIITQNRLTQHLGMFNREVKSADIERLLSPRTEQVATEVTPIQSDTRVEMEMVRGNQSCKSCDANRKSVLNEEFACTGKDLNGMKEDSPTEVECLPISTEEQYGVSLIQDVNTGSQPSAASPTVELCQQIIETEAFQSDVPVALNEQENVPCSLTAPVEPGNDKYLVKKLAQELQKLLDLKAIFPGRNLISETRQAVIRVLQEQKKTLPDFSALAQLKTLANSCNGDIVHADFRSPRNNEQEELKCKSKSSNCSSRTSDQDVSFKKRRGEGHFFFTSPLSSTVHTALRTAEERSGEEESTESFAEPEMVDPHCFFRMAGQPRPHLLSGSSRRMTSVRTSFASDEHCRLKEALGKTARHGLEESFWQPRGEHARSEVAKSVFSKRNDSKRHWVPFPVHESSDSADLNMSSNGPGPFPLTELQQYSCNYELSPDQWNVQEMETAAILNPSQELHSSLPPDLGLRFSESQTSFDVLKSIWSPKVHSRGARHPMSHVLGCSRLAHQPPSPRELNLRHNRQPEDFLQLFSVVPPRHYFCGQNPQQEMCVPSRHQQHGNGLFSAMAHPRTYCPKVSGKQGKPSNGQLAWGLMEAPERMQGNQGRGLSRSGNQTRDLERLLQLDGPQQLQIFQQLPLSYFPPSEALEESTDIPLYTFQGHLLGRQSSPEPWAFPRMKLY